MRGFTLVEMLIVLALLAIIIALSIPLTRRYASSGDLRTAAGTVEQALTRAQTLSQSMDADSAWSVHLTSSSVIVYQGTNFATRTAELDENFLLSGSINLSGPTDITFTKFAGLPTATGTIILQSGVDSAYLMINTKGNIEKIWQAP